MSIRYEYCADLNIVHTYPFGEHTTHDAFTHFKCLTADDCIKSGFIDVVHFETVENFVFRSAEAKQIPRVHNELKAIKTVLAIIFITDTPIQFGMARMMQTLHELNDPDDKVFVVKSEQEAEEVIQELRS